MSGPPAARITLADRAALLAMGFTHIVVIDKDVSVQVPGSVQSAFSHGQDAEAELKRLNEMYAHWAPDAFRVEEL